MSGLRKACLVCVTSLVLISVGTGAAGAATTPPVPKPLQDVVTALTDAVGSAGSQASSGSTPAVPTLPGAPSVPSSPSSPSTSDGATDHGITEPKAPDHASSHVLHGELLPGKTGSTPASADAGSTSSTVNDDNTTSADASLLAVGGMEVVPGAHASSAGQNDASGPAEQVCTGSSGAVCPLHETAHASQSATSSDASSQASAADICLTPPAELNLDLPETTSTDCKSGLGVQALSSTSTIHRDKITGETTGSTSSSLLGLCIPGAPGSGCVGVLGSQGSADSNGTTTRDSSIANFFGTETGSPLDEPAGTPAELCDPSGLGTVLGALGLGDATAGASGLCGYVNQGQTYVSPGLAAVSQTAASGDLLGLAAFDAGHSEVLVHQAPGTTVVSPPTGTSTQPATTAPVVIAAVHHAAVSPASADGGILPHTGGIWSGWLAIGLLCLAAGSALGARDLRRGRVTG